MLERLGETVNARGLKSGPDHDTVSDNDCRRPATGRRMDRTMTDSTAKPAHCLAIETSGRLGSVAIGLDSRILEVATFGADLRHAVELLPTVDRLCEDHQIAPGAITDFYVSAGPGSFTGLRIGITVARMLAWAGDVRVVKVPTLDVIAQNAVDLDDPPEHVASVLDAKRNRVYAAAYVRRNDRYDAITEPAEHDPATFFASLPRGSALIGEGIQYIREAVECSGLFVLPETTFRARADVVYRLGRIRAIEGSYDPLNNLLPTYVRRPDAEEVWDQRHGQPTAPTSEGPD